MATRERMFWAFLGAFIAVFIVIFVLATHEKNAIESACRVKGGIPDYIDSEGYVCLRPNAFIK